MLIQCWVQHISELESFPVGLIVQRLVRYLIVHLLNSNRISGHYWKRNTVSVKENIERYCTAMYNWRVSTPEPLTVMYGVLFLMNVQKYL